MEIVKTRKYTRETFQEKVSVAPAKGGVETAYPFQWLLFKPQAHAIAPFEYNKASRGDNTQRGSEMR